MMEPTADHSTKRKASDHDHESHKKRQMVERSSGDTSLRSISSNPKDVIIVDVGGMRFKTTKQTLCKERNMLSAFVENWAGTDQDTIFIDRDGKHFGQILNYLRDGNVPIPRDETEIQELLIEAEYYSLDGLINRIYPVNKEKERSYMWKIKDFSKINVDTFVSKAFEILGSRWRLEVQFRNGENQRCIPQDAVYFGLFVFFEDRLLEQQTVSRVFDLTVIHPKSDYEYLVRFEKHFTTQDNSWGLPKFLTMKQLVEGEFLENDALIVSVNFS
jgi:hypothetical protein